MPSLQDLVNVKFTDSFIYLCNWLSDVCSNVSLFVRQIGTSKLSDIKAFDIAYALCRKKKFKGLLEYAQSLLPAPILKWKRHISLC